MTQLVLTRIAPWPTGRMLAVIYLALGVVFTPFFFLYAVFSPHESGGTRALSVVFAILMPFFYALCGLVAGMLSAFLYNLFAGMFGGIPLGFQVTVPADTPRSQVGEQPYGQP